ncbi:hypothetical protein LguiB_028417 [Lonicera macranthoides]
MLFILMFSSGGFNISPLKPQKRRPRTQVQHLMQIDCRAWGVHYLSFQQHRPLQMLNSVTNQLNSSNKNSILDEDEDRRVPDDKVNTADELPERLLGAVRISHIELSSAIVPKLEPDSSDHAEA